MTTAFFVGAAYGGIAWGTWMFLTRPLVHIINRSDRIYCLALSILWPAMLASVFASMLLRPRRSRRNGYRNSSAVYVKPSKVEA